MHKNGLDSTDPKKNSKIGSYISRNDVILITVLLAVVLLILGMKYLSGKEGAYVTVRVDQKIYGTYALDKEQEIVIKEDDYCNTIVITDGKARMTQADCPDQICVNHRPVDKNGETIVCLPHKIVVEVTAEEKKGEDIDIITK